MQYHINPETGSPGICTATVRDCKYAVNGEIPQHYYTRDEAYSAYEKTMVNKDFLINSLSKNSLTRSCEFELFSSFEEAQKNYFTYGARSPKKIEPIHKAIATHFIERGLKVSAKGVGDDKEIKVPGKLYDKNCDITIFDDTDNPISVVEVKFITTNYKQNANNYFENFMGATSNLRRNNINVSQFVVIPSDIPYLNKKGEVVRLETMVNRDIDKYRKLMLEPDDNSTPNNLFFTMIDMWNGIKLGSPISGFKKSSTNLISPTKIDNTRFSDENIDFLKKYGNYENFISDVVSQN